MLFALGVIVGLLVAAIVLIAFVYFKNPIIQMTAPAIKKIELAGPRKRGYVFAPESDEEFDRQEIVKKNAEKGEDTRIEELRG